MGKFLNYEFHNPHMHSYDFMHHQFNLDDFTTDSTLSLNSNLN